MADVFGDAGDNNLFGTTGNDRLFGGQGEDRLHASLGNDQLNGGGTDPEEHDEVRYNVAAITQGISVNNTGQTRGGIAAFTVEKGALGTDTLSGIEVIFGSNFNDVIYQGGIADDQFAVIDGAGNDLVIGVATPGSDGLDIVAGSGNDDYRGAFADNFGERIRFENWTGDAVGAQTMGAIVTFTSATTGTIRDPWGDNDVFSNYSRFTGSDFGDRMTGAAGEQRFQGRLGNDSLYGGAGDDELEGGAGVDTLFGGAGFDTVTYEDDFDDGGTAGIFADLDFDFIRDGFGNNDVIAGIEAVIGTQLGDEMNAPNTTVNIAFYGEGGNDTLRGGLGNDELEGWTGNDTLLGNGGNDELFGDVGNDRLEGGDGQDRLEGGDGADALFGGGSDDVLEGGRSNDTLFGGDSRDDLFGGSGNDRLVSGRGNDFMGGGEGDDILDASDGDMTTDFWGDFIKPGLGSDTIIGNQVVFNAGDGIDISYDDLGGIGGLTYSINGMGGGTVVSGDGRIDDTFTFAHYFIGSTDSDTFNSAASQSNWFWSGHAGNDTFNGSSAYDDIDYWHEQWGVNGGGASGVVVDVAAGTATDTYGDTDTFSQIDEITGSIHGDDLSAVGYSQNIQLEGRTGNDLIRSGSGNDRLFGGVGNDTIFGGAGDDRIWLDTGTDFAAGGAGFDRLELDFTVADVRDLREDGANLILTHAGGTMRFREIEQFDFTDGDRTLADLRTLLPEPGRDVSGSGRITGGTGDDTLTGSTGADVLDGGRGADTMSGGQGNDFYFVNDPGDVITGEIAFSQGGGIDTVRAFIDYVQPDNIELVRLGFLTGQANLNATGNDAPGTLVGNAGDNILTGRGGNDQLNGNNGDDTITGNTGADTLVGGNGADTYVFTAYADSRAGAANRDLINGFERGAITRDVIDLSALDANTQTFGVNDAFEFVGTARFSGTAGELRLQGLGGANAVLIEADHNGDGQADLQIFVNLQTQMFAGDFIL